MPIRLLTSKLAERNRIVELDKTASCAAPLLICTWLFKLSLQPKEVSLVPFRKSNDSWNEFESNEKLLLLGLLTVVKLGLLLPKLEYVNLASPLTYPP